MREYRLFTALRRGIPKPKSREARKNAWISAATWRIAKERVSARRYPMRNQALIRRLVHATNASLREDMCRPTE